MSLELNIEKKLRSFSFTDYVLVKLAYLMIGLFCVTIYSSLLVIPYIFLIVLIIIALFPIYLHIFRSNDEKSDYMSNLKRYIESNTPSLQALLFIATFAVAVLICKIISPLSRVSSLIYIILFLIFIIKPFISAFSKK